MPNLSYNTRQSMVAGAAGIESWRIRDCYDDRFIYTDEKTSKLYSCPYVIADGKVTIGTAVEVAATIDYEPITTAAFAMDDADVQFAGDEVLLTGKLFEAGEYPDKNFSITESELSDAAVNFAPVDNDLEHKRTILSGALGQVRSVIANGKELRGTVAVPKWLYDTCGLKSIPTSLTWNRATKRIIGNALVINPRISDAKLVAAFSAATENTLGGVKVPVTKIDKKPGWFEKMKALFSANQLPEGLEDFNPESVTFNEGEPVTPPVNQAVKPETTTEPAVIDTVSAPAANFNTGIQARLLTTDAEKFADAAINAGKAFPAQREHLVAQFKQAVEDDNAGVACFSDDGELNEGKRVKMLRDGIEAATAHKLFQDEIPGSVSVAMFAANTGADPSADELLATTPLGKRAAKLKKEGK